MRDPAYRGAWFVWPQAIGLLVVGTLLATTSPPDPPAPPSGWVHPIDSKTRIDAMKTLFAAAKTEAGSKALLEQKAAAGDPFAQFFMGALIDPTIDRTNASAERLETAEDWYRKAADQNIALAQANLGGLLAHERFGTQPDYVEAFRWLDKAAPHVPAAQRELGLLYRNGFGIPKDPIKGMELIRSAADRGDASAQAILGDALDRGTDDLTVDRHEAALLFQRAAMQNNVFAQRQLAVHLRSGDGIEADPTKARYWFGRAAANGDAYSKAQISQTAVPQTGTAVTPYSFSPIKP